MKNKMKNKKRFISFLKAHSVYELFLQNLDDRYPSIHDLLDSVEQDDWVCYAFNWSKNNQGHEFWDELDDVWYGVQYDEGIYSEPQT